MVFSYFKDTPDFIKNLVRSEGRHGFDAVGAEFAQTFLIVHAAPL